MKKKYLIPILFGTVWCTNAQRELVISYDTAGNQFERLIISPTSSKQLIQENNELLDDELIENQISNSLKIYPNPTAGQIKIEWNPLFNKSIKEISVTDSGAVNTFYANLVEGQNFVEMDLTSYASGLYIIHFVLDDKKVISKKIIKN